MQSVAGEIEASTNRQLVKLDSALERTFGDARGSVNGFDSQITSDAQPSHKGTGQ